MAPALSSSFALVHQAVVPLAFSAVEMVGFFWPQNELKPLDPVLTLNLCRQEVFCSSACIQQFKHIHIYIYIYISSCLCVSQGQTIQFNSCRKHPRSHLCLPLQNNGEGGQCFGHVITTGMLLLVPTTLPVTVPGSVTPTESQPESAKYGRL